jgi:hypothetical protein
MASKRLDIKEVLKNIDANNKDWLSNLPEEDFQAFDPFIVMQFLSSTNNRATHEEALLTVNEVLNKDFTTLYNDKDLFYRLCCVCRGNGKTFRPFVKPPKTKKSTTLLQKLILEYSDENMSELECKLFIQKNKMYGEDFWVDLAESYGWSESDVEKLLKEVKQII